MSRIEAVAQVALSVRDLAAATAFYRDALGMKHLFDAPGMSFFDVGGVRLMLSAQGGEPGGKGTLVYFKVADLAATHAELSSRQVPFEQPPHVIARMNDREISLAWCTDPDGNLLGLMGERTLAAR